VVALLVFLLVPLTVAGYFALAFRRGGGRRLWRDAALLATGLAGFALWQPDVEFYHYGPLAAEGVDTWPFFPVAALAAAAVVHVASRLGAPLVLGAVLAALGASLTLRLGQWIA
jgi:hypothetical protein